jgi:hypothetical protein
MRRKCPSSCIKADLFIQTVCSLLSLSCFPIQFSQSCLILRKDSPPLSFLSNCCYSVHFCVYFAVLCYFWQILLASPLIMSVVPINSQALKGYDCITCSRFVPFKPCQSDVNGNRGRLVAVVSAFVNTDCMRSLVLPSAIMLVPVVSNATLFAGHLVHGHQHVPPRRLRLLFRRQPFLHSSLSTRCRQKGALSRGADRSALRLTVHPSGAESIASPIIRVFALRRHTNA